jgi:hypothetical protein
VPPTGATLRIAIAPLLQYPAVAIRIRETGETCIISAGGVESGRKTSVPGSYRRLVPDLTDVDTTFEQAGPRGLKIRNNEIDVANGPDARIGESVTDLDGATGARGSELHDAEHVVWRIVDVEREADLIHIEAQRLLDITHWERDHFD